MNYVLRDYQQEASNAAIRFFNTENDRNGLLVLPTGAGKSLVIANIAYRLNSPLLVLQPSREILQQNYDKLRSYGVEDCSVYSASLKKKEISRITFATIGSIINVKEDFSHFKYIIVDEAHVVNAKGGMYCDFFDNVKRKILGLTATPYRLCSTRDQYGQPHCILKFLTRTRPRVFHDVVYKVDVGTLAVRGYLSKVEYFDLSIINQSKLKRNTTGMDFDDKGLQNTYMQADFSSYILSIVKRLMCPKVGGYRRGILVFTKFLDEARWLCEKLPSCGLVCGETPSQERQEMIDMFKRGCIDVMVNVGVLTTGFDCPELDTVVMARPTMSLALYYQIIGRGIRPHKSKKSLWFVDLCGNIQRFGRVDDLHLTEGRSGEYVIVGFASGAQKQLTNVYF